MALDTSGLIRIILQITDFLMILQHFSVLLALVNHSSQEVNNYATSDHGILHTKAVVVLIKPFCTTREDILGNCLPGYGAGRHLLGGGLAGGGAFLIWADP